MSEPSTLKRRAKKWWSEQDTKKRQLIIRGSCVAVIASLAAYGFYGRQEKKEENIAAGEKAIEMSMGAGLLKDSFSEQFLDRLDGLSAENAELKERLQAVESAEPVFIEREATPVAQTKAKLVPDLPDVLPFDIESMTAPPALKQREPKPVVEPRGTSIQPASFLITNPNYIPPDGAQPGAMLQPMITGEIGRPLQGVRMNDSASKKKTRTVYLPPGFMKAMLVTGVDALASRSGTENPEPIIARVQAPAQLPNAVKANLSGCFVVGNATGSLAKERVEVQVVSLSCLDMDQNSVIDQAIKGFMTDTDGKKGLSGRVVSRAGSTIARAMLASTIEGFAGAIGNTQGVQAISPLGTTQTFDTGQALTAGAGAGLQGASQQLTEYYLELARQASPVIEVGAAKEVVVVIQQGVEIEIRTQVNVGF